LECNKRQNSEAGETQGTSTYSDETDYTIMIDMMNFDSFRLERFSDINIDNPGIDVNIENGENDNESDMQ
jgi:hypothetical protein